MSSANVQDGGTIQQDRTISDLQAEYRHKLTDPTIPDAHKERAEGVMEDVWRNLAILNDPNGFINHLSQHVSSAHRRRHSTNLPAEETRRTRPLCECDRPRHVCEVKRGELPAKIQTQDLTYIRKPDSRKLAREYIQTHTGDNVISEGVESYQDLRATIYKQLTTALTILRTGATVGAGSPTADAEASDGETPVDEERASEDASTRRETGGVDLPGVPDGV